MRMIIEASKLKVRIKPDGVEAPIAETRAAPAPRPVVSTAAPVVKRAVPAVEVAAPAPTPQAAPVVEQAREAAASVAPVETVTKAAELPPVAVAPALPLQPLKLAQLVEPALPGSVLRRMRNDVEVVVGFTVNANGTVSDVAIQSNPMKALDAPVIEAVAQWRYEPIREARTHAVQLVLRAANP